MLVDGARHFAAYSLILIFTSYGAANTKQRDTKNAASFLCATAKQKNAAIADHQQRRD